MGKLTSVWLNLTDKTRLNYTPRIFFKILLNQTEIRLYFPFFDWLGTKRTSVYLQMNRKMVYTIWFRFDLIKFRKDFSVCSDDEQQRNDVVVLSKDWKKISRHNGGANPLHTLVLWWSEGFQGMSSIEYTWLPGDASLSDSCASDRRCFFMAAEITKKNNFQIEILQ